MTTDKQPPTTETPRRTMSPELRELLKDPIFRLKSSPNGGGIVITGYGPTVPPAEPAPTSTESPKPKPDASHDDE